jgi:hypothetical protein
MAKLGNLALGSFEAAAVMGVHFTRPRRMFDDGLIDGRALDPVVKASENRVRLVYSLKSCEENYAEYERRLGVKGREGVMRPRAWLHERPEALRRLKALKTPILYDDAIGVGEASKIMSVHWTLVVRLINQGKIVGRTAWNKRNAGQKFWIISRSSCEAERKRAAKHPEKSGRPRGAKNKVDK